MQQDISSFFRPAGKPARRQTPPATDQSDAAEASKHARVAAAQAGASAAASGGTAQQQFARKRKRPAGTAAAAEPGGDALAPQQAPPQAAEAQAPPQQQKTQAQQPRQLTQLYLDVGQRHFHSYRCPTCGMLYARGTEADDRLHAAFHASATEGPRYHGWQGEKVVQLDGSRGKVLLFSTADLQGRARKQLQELCTFLEEQMGLPQGWLLQGPLTVLLYVSAARRIQAMVAAEAVREAFAVKPSLPPGAAQILQSCGSAAAASTCAGASGEQAEASGAAATAAGQGGTPGQGPPLPAAAGAHVAAAGRSLLSVTLSSGEVDATAECGAAGVASAEAGVVGCAAQAAAAEVAAAAAAAGARDEAEPGVHRLQAGSEPPPPPLQQQQAQHAQQQQRQPQQAQRAPLEVDRSRRVRAVCGVRLMWVSAEARRRGLATRLLDCCRCHVMQGYVVPRHELAFSAPTDDGRSLVEAYTGTRRFLVYE